MQPTHNNSWRDVEGTLSKILITLPAVNCIYSGIFLLHAMGESLFSGNWGTCAEKARKICNITVDLLPISMVVAVVVAPLFGPAAWTVLLVSGCFQLLIISMSHQFEKVALHH
jgi:hypothetical protein